MRLLLDTHVVLWAVTDAAALPMRFRAALQDGRTELFVSAVSVWEVSIKTGLGKLDVPQDLWDRVAEAGCAALPVTWAHARAVQGLPLHHADPFDRLLIAQAQVEQLRFVSNEVRFDTYGVLRLW